MYKRYFRKKDPTCRPEEIEWIEMSGDEFYRFVTSPEGEGRYFIDINNAVLEASKDEARIHRAEKDRSDYLREQEKKHIILSLQRLEEDGYSDTVLEDKLRDVESDAIALVGTAELMAALNQLDAESYSLIYSLYLDVEKKTERQMASILGISQAAINKRKKKILKTLKFLVCGGDYAGKMHLMMEFTDRPGDVADPWYTDDFDATWRDVSEGCQGLLKQLTAGRRNKNG